MNKRQIQGWIKHGDFILLDILCMQICYALVYWCIRGGEGNPYKNNVMVYQAVLLFVCQIIITLFSRQYHSILYRKLFDEFLAVCRYMVLVFLLAISYLFIIHDSATASRLQIGFTSVFFIVIDTLLRQANKQRIIRLNRGKKQRSLVLITSEKLVDNALQKLNTDVAVCDFTVSRIILMDSENRPPEGKMNEIPYSPMTRETIQNISHEWIDEAFILQPEDQTFPKWLMDDFLTMGIPVSYTMSAICDDKWPITDISTLGEYRVLTSSVYFAEAWELAVKRIMDIVGGLIGCLLTIIAFIFIAPIIYLESPGPIIFSQERIGKNGKVFRMHKFRSMYLDAEERKAELIAENSVQDGMMFKIEDDPRIIGSEKKDRNGKPRGIGNFIRNTSIDEFPQFFDVLIGNMSLVGTRPPTRDEWEKYNLSQRMRMSIKPGMTGLWQISGRSEIKDFEEVVRLDRAYIENWNLLEDIRILFKTVYVVLVAKGAM